VCVKDGAGLPICSTPTCTPITIDPDTHSWFDSVSGVMIYQSTINPGILGPNPDVLELDLYSTTTGTINLGSVANSAMATCTQCVAIITDISGSTFDRLFFQESGTLTINSTASQLNNWLIDATLTNVKLTEVNKTTGARITGSPCFTIASAKLYIEPIPGWECPVNFWDDGECDCMCGIWDPDCETDTVNAWGCDPGESCVQDGGGLPVCE